MASTSDAAAHPEAVSGGYPQPRRKRALSRGTVVGIRLATVALWVLIAVAVVAGIGGFVASRQYVQPISIDIDLPVPSTGVEGFAELYVATFLGQAGEGTEDVLTPFLPEPPRLDRVTPGGVFVTRTIPVEAVKVVHSYWSVTVAVDVLLADEGQWEPGGIRFYRVEVFESDLGWVATGLPRRSLVQIRLRFPTWR